MPMIRHVQPEDRDAIYELLCTLEETALPPVPFDTALQALLKDRGHILLLWQNEDAVLGFLHLRVEPQLHHAAPIAEILELVISPDARGHGAGAALFREACRLAKEAGCPQIEVASSLHREQAHHFYEKMGMKRTHLRLSMAL